MKRFKKAQQSYYSNRLTTPPQLKRDTHKRELSAPDQIDFEITKRTKRQHNNDPVNRRYFDQSMRSYLHSRVLSLLTKAKSSGLDKKLEKLKDELSSVTKLPRGIITEAEKLADLEDNVMRNYIDNNAEKRPFELWQDFVNMNYEDTVKALKSRNLSFSSSSAHQSTPPQPPPANEVYRTFSVSLDKILRQDLDESVSNVVKQKLNESIYQCSDLQAQFKLIIQMMMILLKTNTFTSDGADISLTASNGFDIRQLFPLEFVQNVKMDHVLSTLPLRKNESEVFQKDFALLFTEQHLKLIFSHYFGEKGNLQTSLDSHPVENAFFSKLPLSDITSAFEIPKIPTEQKQNTINSIATNVENMWSDNKIFSKLLDSTLTVLLRLHLAPKRTLGRNTNVKELEIVNTDSETPSIFKKQKRSIVRAEYRNLRKREQKLLKLTNDEKKEAYERGINKNKARITSFKNLAVKKTTPCVNITISKSDNDDKEKHDNDDEEKYDDTLRKDTSRSRLNALKPVAKHLLLSSSEEVTEQVVETELGTSTVEEVAIVTLLVRSFQPYMPKKSERYIIAYQLPFCILANDILTAAGFTKFTRKLFPEPSFSKFQSLELNASSVYQMLTSEPNLW